MEKFGCWRGQLGVHTGSPWVCLALVPQGSGCRELGAVA